MQGNIFFELRISDVVDTQVTYMSRDLDISHALYVLPIVITAPPSDHLTYGSITFFRTIFTW